MGKIGMRKKDGYIDLEVVIAIIGFILIIGVFGFAIYKGIYARTVGNKITIDMNYTFTKAITYIGDEKIELKVKNWNDYDGEQIQVVTEDEKVYLLSTYNTILVSE